MSCSENTEKNRRRFPSELQSVFQLFVSILLVIMLLFSKKAQLYQPFTSCLEFSGRRWKQLVNTAEELVETKPELKGEWNDFRWTLPCTFYQMKVVSMPNLTYSYFVEPSSSGQIRVCACLRLIVTQVIDRLSVRLLISIFIAGGTKITLSIYIGQYTHTFLQISLKCGYQTGTTWFVVEAEHFTD